MKHKLNFGDAPLDEVVKKCKPNKQLTSLTVVYGDVVHVDPPYSKHWRAATSPQFVQWIVVQAETDPNNLATWNDIQWEGGQQAPEDPTSRLIPCGQAGDVEVSAQLANSRLACTITLVAPTLVALSVPDAVAVGHDIWKTYVGADDVVVEAKTDPGTATAARQIQWSGGNPGAKSHLRKVPATAAGEVVVRAGLGGAQREVKVVVLQPPELALKEVSFLRGHPIDNDTVNEFKAPQWEAAKSGSFPICYTRNTPIRLKATFLVQEAPKSDTQVAVRARTTLGTTTLKWECQGTVLAGSTGDVETIEIDSDVRLPDAVGCFDAQELVWEYNPADTGWVSAGKSTNDLYVTLADPVMNTVSHWTVVDTACRAARGCMTEGDVVQCVFKPFQSVHNSIQRKGGAGPKTLGYWTSNNNGHSLHEMLQDPEGGGTCSAWADLLLACYAVHGIDGGIKVLVESDWRNAIHDCEAAFHLLRPGNTAIPGQNNTKPPPSFLNHYIVLAPLQGEYYDPSYGTGPMADLAAWKNASIDRVDIQPYGKARLPIPYTLPDNATATLPGGLTHFFLPKDAIVTYSNAGPFSFANDSNFLLPVNPMVNGNPGQTYTGVGLVPAAQNVFLTLVPVNITLSGDETCDLLPDVTLWFKPPDRLTIPARCGFTTSASVEAPWVTIVFSDIATLTEIERG